MAAARPYGAPGKRTPSEFARAEAALVELYRQGATSHHQLGISLGMTRFETDDLLKRHHVTEDFITNE